MRPTRTFDEDVETIALDFAEDPDDDAEPDEVLTGEADEVAPVLLRAALISFGNTAGPFNMSMFTDPSCIITSLLAARKLRVYMMFSAT